MTIIRLKTRMSFSRKFLFLLTFAITSSLNNIAIAATENFAGAGPFPLAISGDNAALTGQAVTETTLQIPAGFIVGSTTGTSAGNSVTSDNPNTGNVNF
jgi:hypothetical protein